MLCFKFIGFFSCFNLYLLRDLLKRLKRILHFFVVFTLPNYRRAQISVPKIGMPILKPASINSWYGSLGIIFCQNRKMIAPFNSMQELPSLFKANGKMNIQLSQDLK